MTVDLLGILFSRASDLVGQQAGLWVIKGAG